MPPALWNHRCPTGCDTPTTAAASIGNSPLAISTQNAASTWRWNFGCPGDLSFGRIARSAACCRRTTTHLRDQEVLRRPVESALAAPVRVQDAAGDLGAVDAATGHGVVQRRHG